jgi:hypothetical protein
MANPRLAVFIVNELIELWEKCRGRIHPTRLIRRTGVSPVRDGFPLPRE